MIHANSWNAYIYQLHQYIRQQEDRIKVLEQRIEQLESNKNTGNHTTIEKLEYHFDQLKIERLDGTLHIGLTPEELSNADDISVNQPTNPNQHQIVNQLDAYLNEQGPNILQQLAHQYGYPTDQTNQEMLLDDVRKQLPNRVQYYEKMANENSQIRNEYEFTNYVVEQVQKEIYHSLHQYFANKKDEKS